MNYEDEMNNDTFGKHPDCEIEMAKELIESWKNYIYQSTQSGSISATLKNTVITKEIYPDRIKEINKDDITDLQISLNTCQTVDQFIEMM